MLVLVVVSSVEVTTCDKAIVVLMLKLEYDTKVGYVVGDEVGANVGSFVGTCVVGLREGFKLGFTVGEVDCVNDGFKVGLRDGRLVMMDCVGLTVFTLSSLTVGL